MPITIVMGPPCSGKSTFIKENFKDSTVIDLFNFQARTRPSFDSVWKSYVDCAEKLKECIKEGKKNIVLEHTLLRKERREWYISQIREVSNDDIEIYCIVPSKDTLIKRAKSRHRPITDISAEDVLNILEIPTKDEGYSKVHILNV